MLLQISIARGMLKYGSIKTLVRERIRCSGPFMFKSEAFCKKVPDNKKEEKYQIFKSTPDQSWSEYIKSIKNNKEINTVPNMITMARIFSSPALAAAVALDMKYAALGGCVLFGFSDWLDGYLAKKWNQRTVLGAFLDPMADKVMIGALTVGLVAKGLIPVPLACVIIGRDLALVGASFIMRALERPEGAAFFDTTDSATFNIVPSDMSKINTGVQFVLLSATLSSFAVGYPTIEQLEPLWWITATTTLASGMMYMDGSGRVTITRTVKEIVVDKVGPTVIEAKKNAIEIKSKIENAIEEIRGNNK
jgi:cardiolipin synthase (CMP-forming)